MKKLLFIVIGSVKAYLFYNLYQEYRTLNGLDLQFGKATPAGLLYRYYNPGSKNVRMTDVLVTVMQENRKIASFIQPDILLRANTDGEFLLNYQYFNLKNTVSSITDIVVGNSSLVNIHLSGYYFINVAGINYHFKYKHTVNVKDLLK